MSQRRQVADHNGEKWLEVRFLAAGKRGMLPRRPAGWFVVRVCPCHSGIPVTIPFNEQPQAERVKQLLITTTNTKP